MSSVLLRCSNRRTAICLLNLQSKSDHSHLRSITTTSVKLSKLTEQKYDEAQLMSERLNSQPYYAKRPQTDLDSMIPSGQEREATEEEMARYRRLEALKGLATGLVILTGIFGSFITYQKWPAIKGWWNREENDEEFQMPKKVKKVFELPVITNQNGSDVPGLYLCGDNSNWCISEDKKSVELKFPLRFSWFDGKTLRDVHVGEFSGVAVDSNGDLIQWGRGFNNDNVPQYSIKGQNITKATISNGVIYALTKKGEILTLPESDQAQAVTPGLIKRSWTFQTYETNFNKIASVEPIVDIQTGDQHLLALSKSGKVYAASTGLDKPTTKSQGQFGIPEFSQFNSAPEPGTLHDITLLNQAVFKTAKGKIDHVRARKIVQIAAGSNHSMALDSNGEVFTFGRNTYGQLGHPVNYNSEIIAVPKKVDLIAKQVNRDLFAKVVDIEANGDFSFCSVSAVPLYRLVRTHGVDEDDDVTETTEDSFVVGFGNNLKGQLGTGHYVHAQFDPVRIKELSKFEDYNETTNQLEKIEIANWSVGKEHTVIKLDNGDVLQWGANDFGQLGNGKKNRIPKPSNAPRLIEPDYTVEMYKDLTFVNRLQLQDNQQIKAGVQSTAVFYTKK
ncbi:hypothetical protein WICPIJ_008686 [Wickerhamomyces pijperi]|uniref:Uncharacterized protein n=1 Tax=Wickerhamomyces pijperi TaxID=599730 RepID=A0A9P8PVK5_WICPI|nr:hypothetical protein WICPIJ_008686 [Wickerhamomyces pijperi]